MASGMDAHLIEVSFVVNEVNPDWFALVDTSTLSLVTVAFVDYSPSLRILALHL